MITEWNLRDEMMAISHRWPLPLLAFLLGSLLAWLAYPAVDTPYRAEISLNVAYNGDLILRNPDDYKNGQMAQLNLFITSRDVLGETLQRLRKREPYWNNVSIRELEAMVDTYWRNVGRWRLAAEASNPQRASMLVQTWEEVALEKITTAIFHSQRMLKLETEFKSIANAQADVRMRAYEIDQVKAALEAWKQTVAETEGPLPASDRWRLESFVARAVNLDGSGLALLAQIPPPDAPALEYVPWADRALAALETEQTINNTQIDKLARQYDEVYQRLSDALTASRGLTSYLRVESLTADEITAAPVRNRPEMALVGGLIGLLGWGLIWFVRPVIKTRQ